MDEHLKQAIERIGARAYPEALEALVEAWRVSRAPAVAMAVDRLDALLGQPAFAQPATSWLEAARATDEAAARGPLIRAVATMTRKQISDGLALMASWDDPRVGTLVSVLLRELRFTGAISRTFWRDVCALIPDLSDPRFLELPQTLPASWNVGEDLRRYLTNRLAKAVAEVAPAKSLTAMDAKAVDELLVSLGGEKKQVESKAAAAAGSAASAAEILARVHEAPTEDEPRAIYADWLLERGDPRGELIALQLWPDYDTDKKAQKRAKELLKAHKKQWLGGVAPMLGGALEFRRGFVAVATAKFRTQKDVEQYGSLPEWATLEELECGGPNVRGDQLQWGYWIGPSMRHARVVVSPMAKHLLHSEVNWAVEELTLKGYPEGLVSAEEYRQILTSPRLPDLRRLYFVGSIRTGWLEGVTRCPATLAINRRLDNDERDQWLAVAERTEAERFELDQYGVRNTFSRDDHGRLTRLETLIVPPTKVRSLEPLPRPLAQLIEALDSLEPGSLTHFNAEIVVGGKRVVATPALEAAQHLVRPR